MSIELRLLEAKRSALFECIQKTYNLSTDLANEEDREKFLDACVSIDIWREEFRQATQEYNQCLLSSKPDASPNFQSLISFDELFGRIKRTANKFTMQGQNQNAASGDCAIRKGRPSLPPIELMAFDGDIRSWPLFYASFKSTIHDNPSLTDAEKLYYLLGKLSGKAQNACAGITPCASNYKLLMKSLIDKYEDKRTLASTYLDQILDFKPLTAASVASFDIFTERFVAAVGALQNLKIDKFDDFIMLHVALNKLDPETRREFEIAADTKCDKIPAFSELVDFIKSRSKIMSRSKPSTSSLGSSGKKSNANHPPNYQSYVTTVNAAKCLCDNIVHDLLFKCPQFVKLTPGERFKCVKERNACVNCLSTKHKVSLCKSEMCCRFCKLRHHTQLHFHRPDSPRVAVVVDNTELSESSVSQLKAALPTSSTSSTAGTSNAGSTSAPTACVGVSKEQNNATTVLLATAQVVVHDGVGNDHLVRCLLDSASQTNFITAECSERIGLCCQATPLKRVRGIGGVDKPVKGSVELEFASRFNPKVKYNVSSLVVDKITDNLPIAFVNVAALTHLTNLQLADDNFATPNQIDMLVGASIFPHLLLPGVVRNSDARIPPAIETVLGYIIMGSVPTLRNSEDLLTACCVFTPPPPAIDMLVKKFWELEEVQCPPAQCREDMECEEFYRATTVQDPASGRYVVALPFREDACLLGNSDNVARRRFLCLERKLEASPKLRVAYDDVIRDHLENNYLVPTPGEDATKALLPLYTIPHHPIIREDKTTTKLRVVLDASCKTSSGYSLNDVLHCGPNLQGDLFQILLNFRLFSVALSADCKQMYLQLLVREEDQRYQRIYYRFNPHEPLILYQFNRVCFGLKSSPFHALRSVQQMVEDNKETFPDASTVVSQSIYMDDIVCSVMTEKEGVTMADELIRLFKCAQWDLVKWNSNSKAVLDSLPASHKLTTELEFDKEVQHKILGLRWSNVTDDFRFEITGPSAECTKRSILSTTARLWDIMGFVAPTVLYAKLLIKQLWQLKLDWDDTPPPHIVKIWEQFCAELPALNHLRIPRFLGVKQECVATLLGFSDASELAYGAVVYLLVNCAGKTTVTLVCAKSKVAPLKTQSIARLELCGALLLSKLMRVVYDNYNARFEMNLFAFTDSKIVLCWIKSSPHRWQTFVANRVVKLTENISAERFHHVAGIDNPADCLSRGVSPKKLMDQQLWLNGPPWATLDTAQWPINKIDLASVEIDIPEEKVLAHVVVNNSGDSVIYDLAMKLSSWSRLIRCLVYVFRFVKWLPYRKGPEVTMQDLDYAENKLVEAVQRKHFANEINNIQQGLSISNAMLKLKPFLKEGLIRVGGRLTNANVVFDQKHPVILPRNDHVTNLLIDYYHKTYMHAGPEVLGSLLKQRYWILAARGVVRYRIFKCNVCFRLKPRSACPLMADLPDVRVKPVVKAFTHTGCDYAGPIKYTPIRRRGVISQKLYLCIFTCLTTRACHIEIARELSTACFLAALKRFLSRRGPVQCMYTDNGTNFVGARSYLRDLYTFLDQRLKGPLQDLLAENRISWKFNPPASPHFGGCWESMVKVIKAHLYRVIGQQLLSYEELNTVLVQIEAVVNSRPLTVLSSDPSEPSALTPSHFLHTVPLNSLPAPEVLESNVNLLHRHELMDKMVQSFWKRWRVEYLHKLQTREKWNTPSTPVQVGTVVVILTDNAPPLTWPLGVVEKVHPAKDGIVRVVTVSTAKGLFVRPVVKLCPLPNQ